MNRPIVICASLCVMLSASGAHAQTTGKGVADLTLEELMDVRVTATTRMGSMPIDKAPGVVRVFTRADIERFGFVTLRDVLANVAGVQIQEFRGGHQAVWFRGIKQRYNNKVLWLVDGVPFRDSYYGHQSIDEVLPLDMVERIEIITGPGSVLYGANAFAGVVSITTKSSHSRDVRNLRAAYGTYDTGSLSAEGAAGPAYGLVNHLMLGNDEYSINTDRSTIRGLELQAQAHPTDRINVTVGVSRLLSATETMGALDPSVTPSLPVSPGTIDAEFLAKYTANALVDYRLTTRGDRIGLHVEGLSRRLVPPDYQSSVPIENRDTSNAAGFVRVDAFATIRLKPRAYLDVKALNLFDRTIFSPSFDNVSGYDTEWQGRSFRVQLSVKY